MSAIKKENEGLMEEINEIVHLVVSMDQDCAILESFYKESAKDTTIATIDNALGKLSRFREKIKKINKESYIKKSQ